MIWLPMTHDEPGDQTALPVGWEWAEADWHPSTDPIWKAYRMARHDDGRLANFERRTASDGSSTPDDLGGISPQVRADQKAGRRPCGDPDCPDPWCWRDERED